jgi:hypothetical protein
MKEGPLAKTGIKGVRTFPSPLNRIFQRLDITSDSDCLFWTGKKDRAGYGKFKPKGKKQVFVHRYLYSVCEGEIPPGMMIDHLCRNHNCVNPFHLRAVTPYVNALENSNCVSANNKNKTHCVHGHAFDDINTYVNKMGHRSCKRCGNEKSNRGYHMRRFDYSI